MTPIWGGYIWIVFGAVMAGGLAWIIHKLVEYLRNEKERQAQWTELAFDEQFKEHLKSLKDKKDSDPEDP